MKKNIILLFCCITLLLLLCSCRPSHECEAGEWEEITPPTCTEKGLNIQKCTLCGKILNAERSAPNGHSYRATFDDNPHTPYVDEKYHLKCTVCGYFHNNEDGENHNLTWKDVSPTCTDLGYRLIFCWHCDYTEKINYSTRGHNYAKEYLYDGSFHWNKCHWCGATSTPAEHIEDGNGSCTLCGAKVSSTPGVVYELSEDGSYAIITGYSGSAKKINIASEYNGVPVTHIGANAFAGKDDIETVVLTDSITHIGEGAFYRCYSLRSVKIGNGVTEIKANAFKNCTGLSDLELGENIRTIGDEAFLNCYKIESIKLPDGLISIGSGAFSFCYSLNRVELPDSLTSIEEEAFKDCINLAYIVVGRGLSDVGSDAFNNCNKINRIFYKGTADDWNAINIQQGNSPFTNYYHRYYFSETKPEGEGQYWYYNDDGLPVIWKILW